jgi:hypothetical protein
MGMVGAYALQRVPLPSGPVRHSGVEVMPQCMHVRPVITRGSLLPPAASWPPSLSSSSSSCELLLLLLLVGWSFRRLFWFWFCWAWRLAAMAL